MASKDTAGLEDIELEEATEENLYLHMVSETPDVRIEVDLHIAIVGKIGSGRSSFVNAIRDVKEDDENAAKPEEREDSTPEVKRFLSYFPPENNNVHFCILPSIDNVISSQSYLTNAKVEMYDVFLLFVSASCNEQLLSIAKKVKSRHKPIFFVQIGLQGDAEKATIWHEFSRMELEYISSKVYRIDVHQQYKHHFCELTKAIADILPYSKKESFSQIPKVGELLAMHYFKEFVKEKEEKKIIPSGNEIEKLLAKSGIMGVQHMMDERLKRWEDVKINLAILGNSGSGKSSFINAIRELRSCDPLGARSGSTETTKVPKSYQHPTNPNILFWDLPGIGTLTHPKVGKFCEEMKINHFDTFLIIASESFTKFHRQFAEKVTSMEKPYFFVRSKIDNAINDENLDNNLDENQTLEKVRKDCVQSLQGTIASEEDIFLISNRHQDKWDFNRLKIAICDKFTASMKESFILSLRASSEEILRAKIEVLGERRWMASVASIMTKLGFGPLSLFIDKKRIKKRVNFYRSQLGFPEIDSEEFQKLSEELQKRVERFDIERVGRSGRDLVKWMKSIDHSNEFNIRIHKPFIITKKPFRFVDLFLQQVLLEMESAAKAILRETAEK
ncbi:interferon-inducible GTPase 1-like [Dendronephthya gigantea]|uniref:interferon-inducible GTPase 1-like n=1 Tax=Dendronephthya gigantea TaxID=151771 RepID=UPI00106C6440|nr:interferon-inducible GTPase 1-like [Dendronephthya gigantea]